MHTAALTPEDAAIYHDKYSDTMALMALDSSRESESISGTLPLLAGISGMTVSKLVTNRINNRGA